MKFGRLRFRRMKSKSAALKRKGCANWSVRNMRGAARLTQIYAMPPKGSSQLYGEAGNTLGVRLGILPFTCIRIQIGDPCRHGCSAGGLSGILPVRRVGSVHDQTNAGTGFHVAEASLSSAFPPGASGRHNEVETDARH